MVSPSSASAGRLSMALCESRRSCSWRSPLKGRPDKLVMSLLARSLNGTE